MIEKDTNYSFMLESERPLNFQKMKAVSDQFILNLSKELQEKLFDGLTQTTQSLTTEPTLAANLYAFGDIQEARLKRAYSYFSKSFFNKEIEIIDYDCGQGIAEIVYHDFLKTKGIAQKIHRITLINSSDIALKRAGLHAKLVFPEVEIRTIYKTVKELKPEDIPYDENLTKLHLLMNIPAMGTEAAVYLSKVIKAGLNGLNYFMCLSPYYGDSSELLKQMNAFVEIMKPERQLRYAEDLDADQFVPKKSWTCSLRIFVKDETKDGELVSEKNVKYWIDRDDVKYSEDKATLVKCPRSMQGEYILPNAIHTISPKAFRGCENLEVIIANNPYFTSVDGVLYSRDMTRLVKYPQAKTGANFAVPGTVTVIDPYAFAGCVYLEDITLPSSLTTLGFGAFECCTQLVHMVIPESVIRIEGSVFASCTSLNTVDFNPISCESMENIETDDEGISCREALAFEGCTSLETICIGSGVSIIPDFAFSFCEYVSSVVFPESVGNIGRNAFSYCKQLKEVTLTASITAIGKDAFFWCKNLQTIWVPQGMSLYFKKFTALKDFAACIKEEREDDERLATSSRVMDAIAAAVESIEVIEHNVPKSDEPETLKITQPEPENVSERVSEDSSVPSKQVDIPVQENGKIRIEPLRAQMELPEEKIEKQQSQTDDPIIRRMHELAEQGDAKIQNKLGYLYEVGEKVEQNEIEAIKWYQKAAEQGYSKAQFNLAKQYALGAGVAQSDSEAMKWFLAAADQGLVNAMNNVGAMYATGRGVEKSEAMAVEWYKKAAQMGDPIAIRNLQKRGVEI